ncbi:MAG TPA: hypothetical protein VHB21_28470, partial [Minicystis sp.]|nr:hypothetical protein [Minicystis sp.]
MYTNVECSLRRRFDAAALAAAHPPRFQHPHKRAIYELAQKGGAPAGTIHVSRWRSNAAPEALPAHRAAVHAAPTPLEYDGDDAGVWHMNFADPVLF